MSDKIATAPPKRSVDEVGVSFPFLLALEHPTIDAEAMFRLTQALDMYEIEEPENNEQPIKDVILIDVLEVTPNVTTIKVTPAHTQTYLQLLAQVDLMLTRVSGRFFKSKMKIVRLTWEIDKTGVASDLRGLLHKVM